VTKDYLSFKGGFSLNFMRQCPPHNVCEAQIRAQCHTHGSSHQKEDPSLSPGHSGFLPGEKRLKVSLNSFPQKTQLNRKSSFQSTDKAHSFSVYGYSYGLV
jgi:hypothetical protein